MIPFVIIGLFFALLILLGFKYDEIMPPILRYLINLDSIIFRGRRLVLPVIETYRVGIFPKIFLLLMILMFSDPLFVSSYTWKWYNFPEILMLAYCTYTSIFGWYKIDLSDNNAAIFHSIARSKMIKFAEITKITEETLGYKIESRSGNVSYSKESDSYRKFTSLVKSKLK